MYAHAFLENQKSGVFKTEFLTFSPSCLKLSLSPRPPACSTGDARRCTCLSSPPLNQSPWCAFISPRPPHSCSILVAARLVLLCWCIRRVFFGRWWSAKCRSSSTSLVLHSHLRQSLCVSLFPSVCRMCSMRLMCIRCVYSWSRFVWLTSRICIIFYNF